MHTSPSFPRRNQTTGLDGKVMTYDGENRPVSVSFAGKTTTYLYGGLWGAAEEGGERSGGRDLGHARREG